MDIPCGCSGQSDSLYDGTFLQQMSDYHIPNKVSASELVIST
jgi:hypothetical protein